MNHERCIVVMSNYWHNPNIKVTVWYNDTDAKYGAIRLEIKMVDFLAAVIAELGWFARFLLKRTLNKSFVQATDRALKKVKQASVYVPMLTPQEIDHDEARSEKTQVGSDGC